MHSYSFSDLQYEIRARSARAIHKAGSSHIGGVYSSADIFALIYSELLREGSDGFFDSFVLSKGHCGVGVYAALNCLGYISDEEFDTYCENGSRLMAHISHKVPRVEFSTGSLGHALPFALGKCIYAKKQGQSERLFYVLMSDGELNEGSNWEAFMLAGHLGLSNLIVFIDYNKLQSLTTTYETLDLEPIEDKFRAFNWNCQRCSGHDYRQLRTALHQRDSRRPNIIICDTIKGYPIDFMMNKVEWHYRPPNIIELEQIENQLQEFYK